MAAMWASSRAIARSSRSLVLDRRFDPVEDGTEMFALGVPDGTEMFALDLPDGGLGGTCLGYLRPQVREGPSRALALAHLVHSCRCLRGEFVSDGPEDDIARASQDRPRIDADPGEAGQDASCGRE
jgi:hypothetical protein